MTTEARRGPFYDFSEDSRVRVSLMLVLIGGVGWLFRELGTMKSELQTTIAASSEKYVSKEVFAAEMRTIQATQLATQVSVTEQLRDIKDEIKELKNAQK